MERPYLELSNRLELRAPGKAKKLKEASRAYYVLWAKIRTSEFIPCDGDPLEILSGSNDLVLKSLFLLVNIDSGAQDGRSETDYQVIAPNWIRDDGA